MTEHFILWGSPRTSTQPFQATISQSEVDTVLAKLAQLKNNSELQLNFSELALALVLHTDVLRLVAGGTDPHALEEFKAILKKQLVGFLQRASKADQKKMVEVLGKIIRQEIHQGWPVYDKVCPGNLVLSWMREALIETNGTGELHELITHELLQITASSLPLISFDTRGEAAELFLTCFKQCSSEQQHHLTKTITAKIEALINERKADTVAQTRDPQFIRYYLPSQSILETLKASQTTIRLGQVQSMAHAAMQRDTTIDPMPRIPYLTEDSQISQTEHVCTLLWQGSRVLARQQAIIDLARLAHRLQINVHEEALEWLNHIATVKQGYHTHPEAEKLIMRDCAAPLWRKVLDYVVHPLQIVASDGYESYTVAMLAKLASEPSISGAHTAYARIAIQAFGHSALGFQDASFLGMESKANWVPHGEDRPVLMRVGKATVWGKGAVASLNAGGFWATRHYFGSWFTGIRIHDHLHGAKGGALGRLGIVPYFIVVDLPDAPFPPIPGYYEMADFVKPDRKLKVPAGKRYGEIKGFYSLKVEPSPLKLTYKDLL